MLILLITPQGNRTLVTPGLTTEQIQAEQDRISQQIPVDFRSETPYDCCCPLCQLSKDMCKLPAAF